MKLIKFKQENCTPCKMLDTFLKNEVEVEADLIANITTGQLTDTKTGEVKADEAFMLAGQFGIMKTPTLVLVDDNFNEIQSFRGVGQTGVREILTKRGLI
ncbi:thioredoxin domain-containing protein [Bacillus cereus group sp. MYBK139-2]|uniref:thioredoxin domain-containing protein n=1 Tax=unclassified Bacillus cereus group TaxID=2750818 RepID=UPI003F79CAFB